MKSIESMLQSPKKTIRQKTKSKNIRIRPPKLPLESMCTILVTVIIIIVIHIIFHFDSFYSLLVMNILLLRSLLLL